MTKHIKQDAMGSMVGACSSILVEVESGFNWVGMALEWCDQAVKWLGKVGT